MDIQPPNQLKPTPTTGRPTKYTPEMANNILLDIATTVTPIDKVSQQHGITDRTLYRWILESEDFCRLYMRALENRALVYASDITQDLSKLKDICDDESKDPRFQNVQTGYFDKKWRHLEWMMERFNRQVFGQKLDIDQHLTVEPQQLRTTAWEEVQAEQQAEPTNVDNSPASG